MSRVAEQTKSRSQTKKGSKDTSVAVETAADILVSALKMYDDAGGVFDIISLPEKNGVGIFLGSWKYQDGELFLVPESEQ